MSRQGIPTDIMGCARTRRCFFFEGVSPLASASTGDVDPDGHDSDMPTSIDSTQAALLGVARPKLPEDDEGQVVGEEPTPENRGRHNGGGHGDPDVLTLVDLVELLSSSEDPVWELVRFEVGSMASDQVQVSQYNMCNSAVEWNYHMYRRCDSGTSYSYS